MVGVKLIPKFGSDSQDFQGQGDQPGGEAIHGRAVVMLRAIWWLIVRMANLVRWQSIQAGHVHAVIVDQMQPAGSSATSRFPACRSP